MRGLALGLALDGGDELGLGLLGGQPGGALEHEPAVLLDVLELERLALDVGGDIRELLGALLEGARVGVSRSSRSARRRSRRSRSTCRVDSASRWPESSASVVSRNWRGVRRHLVGLARGGPRPRRSARRTMSSASRWTACRSASRWASSWARSASSAASREDDAVAVEDGVGERARCPRSRTTSTPRRSHPVSA